MKPSFMGLVFLALGALLADGAINDRNPIEVLKAVFTGQPIPKKGTLGKKYVPPGSGDIPNSHWSAPLKPSPNTNLSVNPNPNFNPNTKPLEST